jgi:hypothetical protein
MGFSGSFYHDADIKHGVLASEVTSVLSSSTHHSADAHEVRKAATNSIAGLIRRGTGNAHSPSNHTPSSNKRVHPTKTKARFQRTTM